MITVTVFIDSGHNTGIEMSGHAGSAQNPEKDQDLVCAAASALAINMANSVERFTDDTFRADTGENDGYFRFMLDRPFSPESELLLNSLIFGLGDLADTYGELYLTIRYQEV